MDLDKIGDEDPEDESRVGVETQVFWACDIPGKPSDGPTKNDNKEAESANFLGDGEGQLIHGREAAIMNVVDILNLHLGQSASEGSFRAVFMGKGDVDAEILNA